MAEEKARGESTLSMGEVMRCVVLYDQRGGEEVSLRIVHVIAEQRAGASGPCEPVFESNGGSSRSYSSNLRNFNCGGIVLWRPQGFVG